MEAFTLCWMFDQRWLCNLANPFLEFLLIMPIIINTVALIGLFLQKANMKIQVDSYFILLVVLYGLLAVSSLFLLIRTYLKSQQRLKNVKQNYSVIAMFTHSFQLKKGIWSWIGLIITILSIVQIIINKLYISHHKGYPCYTNITRFYIDLCFWGYIALIIICFLIFKLVFLAFAWKNPERYLTYKSVV